jgi:hypothetical protein
MSARRNMNILKPSELEMSDLTCSPVKQAGVGKNVYLNHGSAKGPLFIQPPELEVKWDSGNWFPSDKNKDSGKYKVGVEMKGDDPEMLGFVQKFQILDDYIKNMAIENSMTWFQKKSISMDTIENIYYPIVKLSMDKTTGEPDGKYPPSFQFKIPQYDGVVQCKIFDSDKKELNVNDPSQEDFVKVGIEIPWDDRMIIPHEGLFKKGVKVKVLLKCSGIWITGGKFGCTWQAMQMRVTNPQGLDSYAFLEDSEEEEVTEKIQENLMDSSEEEDEA